MLFTVHSRQRKIGQTGYVDHFRYVVYEKSKASLGDKEGRVQENTILAGCK